MGDGKQLVQFWNHYFASILDDRIEVSSEKQVCNSLMQK